MTSALEVALNELNVQLNKRPRAKFAFNQMPPSHKQQYLKFIAEAKKAETRARRIEKSLDMLEAWWMVRQAKHSGN